MKLESGKNSFSVKAEKIDREIVQRLADELRGKLLPFTIEEKWFVGGSMVRGCEKVGDLDICVVAKDPTGFLSQFLCLGTPIVSGQVSRIGAQWEGREIQVDLWFANHVESWGAMCMFVAGSGDFNITQRARAGKQGYVLSQNGLYEKVDGASVFVPCLSEHAVYERMGWDWVPYENRNLKFKR